MYHLDFLNHSQYGNIISLSDKEDGMIVSPFEAVNQLKSLKQIYSEMGHSKIRFLIDNQIMNIKQAEKWASEQYQELPKCDHCQKLLDDDVFIHRLSGDHLFCTQSCADTDYYYQLDKLADEEEIDYL